MSSQIQVGSILVADRPSMVRELGIAIEPYAGNWSLVRLLNGRDLDRKVRAAGWNFFFIAGEVRARFFGAASENGVRSALMRIAAKKLEQSFNCLEVTRITGKHFLGVPYSIISAHCRHIQPSWRLDDIQQRRTEEKQAEWALG